MLIIVGLLLIACVLLVAGNGFSAADADRNGGYYQRFAGAFLEGQLSLEETPPQTLIDAKKPFELDFDVFDHWYGFHDAIFKDERVVPVRSGENTLFLRVERTDGVSPTWFESATVEYDC